VNKLLVFEPIFDFCFLVYARFCFVSIFCSKGDLCRIGFSP
jgi:hypothetical protein